MISKKEFIKMSLDLNLFFLRIMKEHSLFLELGFMPNDSSEAAQAKSFRMGFEKLLSQAVALADGNVSREALKSDQFVTQFTLGTEKLTRFYTGIPFDTKLTKKELELKPACHSVRAHVCAVDSLNRKAFKMTSALAEFKRKLLKDVLACKKFTFNYPLLIKHILREARLYLKMLDVLNKRRVPEFGKLLNQEAFWNRQMAEHAKFVAGLLDPTEEGLINAARMFGKKFDKLSADARQALKKTADASCITKESIMATKSLRDFKAAGTQGLLDCKIRSIIIPLLADHILREANHYLFVLGVFGKK